MLTALLFGLFATIAVASSLLVITRRNPVASALWLIMTFFSLAAIFTLLGAFFIGVIQVLVYAGAIMVLFLFVIMLLNLGNDYQPDLRGMVWRVVAGGSSLVMLALIGRVVGARPVELPGVGPARLAAQVAERGAVGAVGIPMYQDYGVALQVTGILLLIACIGAVVLGKRNP